MLIAAATVRPPPVLAAGRPASVVRSLSAAAPATNVHPPSSARGASPLASPFSSPASFADAAPRSARVSPIFVRASRTGSAGAGRESPISVVCRARAARPAFPASSRGGHGLSRRPLIVRSQLFCRRPSRQGARIGLEEFLSHGRNSRECVLPRGDRARTAPHSPARQLCPRSSWLKPSRRVRSRGAVRMESSTDPLCVRRTLRPHRRMAARALNGDGFGLGATRPAIAPCLPPALPGPIVPDIERQNCGACRRWRPPLSFATPITNRPLPGDARALLVERRHGHRRANSSIARSLR